MSPLSFPKHVKLVERAEMEAHRMKHAAGFPIFGATHDDWVAAFGATEAELRELLVNLERRLNAMPRRKRREREAIVQHYARVRAMISVAHGLTTVWSGG